jgi:predicted glycosyltransferase
MLSAHNDHESKLVSVLQQIKEKFDDTQIVFIPRGESDTGNFRKLDLIIPEASIDTLSLYSFASLMIGAGSCMNREACIGGCPTISICPDKLPGVDRLLIDNKLMWHTLEEGAIVKLAADILDGGFSRERNGEVVGKFEDPYGRIMDIVQSYSKG